MPAIQLDLGAPADSARRHAIRGGLDFDTGVQVQGALAELVKAEGLPRHRQQRGPLFGKHRRHLPLGGAMNAGVGSALFPPVQVSSRLFHAFETHSLQERSLRVDDPGSTPREQNRDHASHYTSAGRRYAANRPASDPH